MSISTQDPVLAWRRIKNYTHSFKPSVQLQVEALRRWLTQHGGNPDLQVVPFTNLSSSEVVIADAACKLYALILKHATATATFSKMTDNATTSSDTAAEFVIWSGAAINQVALCFPDGVPFANGITMQGNTTADGGTGSSTNGCTGFAVIGAA